MLEALAVNGCKAISTSVITLKAAPPGCLMLFQGMKKQRYFKGGALCAQQRAGPSFFLMPEQASLFASSVPLDIPPGPLAVGHCQYQAGLSQELQNHIHLILMLCCLFCLHLLGGASSKLIGYIRPPTSMLMARSRSSNPPCMMPKRFCSCGRECAAMQRSIHRVVLCVASSNLRTAHPKQLRCQQKLQDLI